MFFHPDTTTLTTEGVKKIYELENKPFMAIVNGNTYSVPLGVVPVSKRDFYHITTKNGFNSLVTTRSKFMTPEGYLKSPDEYSRPEKMQLSYGHNRFEAEYEYSDAEGLTEILPEYEFYSSGFHQGLIRSLYKTIGSLTLYGIVFKMPSSELDRMLLFQKILMRLGVQSYLFVRYSPCGIIVPKESYQDYVETIGFDDNTVEDALLLENKQKNDIHAAKFRSLEWFASDYAYKIEVPFISMIDIDCFLMSDSTIG